MAFVAALLGRRLAYTDEVAELAPGERLVMRTAEGTFPMGDHLQLAGLTPAPRGTPTARRS